MDKGYFTVESTEKGERKAKRDSGATGKQNLLISAKSTPLEDPNSSKKSKHVRYFKAKVLENHKAKEINRETKEAFNKKSIVFTDKSTLYLDIADYVEMHVTKKSTKKSTAETLRWVHIFISNPKETCKAITIKLKEKPATLL